MKNEQNQEAVETIGEKLKTTSTVRGFFSSYLKRLTPKKTVIIIIVLVVLILILVASFKNGHYETHEVERGDLIEVIEVSGKLVPAQEVELSFEVSGRVSSINYEIGDEVKVGDVLVNLDLSEINSQINEAYAGLRTEDARLSEISGSLGSQNRLESVKSSLLSTINKAYTTADDIIRNSADTFFTDADSPRVEFDQALTDYFKRLDLRNSRQEIETLLVNWRVSVDGLSIDSVGFDDAIMAVSNTEKIENFLSKISGYSNEFKAYSGKTQSQIDSYLANISSSRSTAAGIIADLNSATEDLRDVEAELPIIQASVEGARASIGILNAQRNKLIIKAPFDGVITDEDIEVGQVINANDIVMSMISDQSLEIESFVPEVNISGVDIDDSAELIFDAFGDEQIFTAKVSHIDPRETLKDGVTTYRITLSLDEDDERSNDLFSGMTSEVKVEKSRTQDVIVIPNRYVRKIGDRSYVEIFNKNKKEERDIVVGGSDGRGNVSVVEGLSVGDMVIIPQ